jgi:hypothetical protein
MATPFYGTIVIRNLDGTTQIDRFDSTDVTTAFVTFKSAGGGIQLKANKSGHIVDVVTNIVALGDTKDFKLHINQRDTNIRWVQTASFPTTDNRMFNLTPIPIAAGAVISIEAIT